MTTAAPAHGVDIQNLEKKVNRLGSAITKLGNDKDLQELILILHQPGWTTPAELKFATAMVDHMTAQVDMLGTLKGEFIRACREVRPA
jgi:hypothetical protein